MKKTALRAAALCIACVIAAFPVRGATADVEQPVDAVRLVVPFSAGGVPDSVARLFAQRLGEIWKKPVIVENKAGGDSVIGTREVVRAKADGNTILVNISLLVQNPSLRANLPFDVFKDLTPVAPLSYEPLFLVAGKSLNAPNVKSFLAVVKAHPGRYSFGSYGNGSTAHVLLASLQQSTGLEMIHIPYKGTAPVAQALISGEIEVGLLPYGTARTVIATGKGVPIAVTGIRRSPALPDVPTLREAGIAGFERLGWVAMFVPSATPRAVVDKITRDANEALRSPVLQRQLLESGSIPAGGSAAAFADLVRQDYAYWRRLIRAANVKLD